MLTARVFRRDEGPLWNEFVRNSKNGTFLFCRDYMDYHADRFEDFSAIVESNGRPLALFPASRRDGRVISHGGLTYGGMVSDVSMTTSKALDTFEAWLTLCRSNGVEEILYKSIPHIYHRAFAEEDKYALFYFGATLYRRDVLSVVDLNANIPFQKRRDRGVAKARKSGVVIIEDDDYDTFWELLEGNLGRRYGVRPVHAVEEIKLLKSRFPENINLMSARVGDVMCAGIVLFNAGPAIHVQYSASNELADDTGAIDLLFSTALQTSRSAFQFFDFGISNENEGKYLNRGLVEFKDGFGGRAVCHDFYRLTLG